jgi:hypothetical protein
MQGNIFDSCMSSYFFACTDFRWGDALDNISWGVDGRASQNQITRVVDQGFL